MTTLLLLLVLHPGDAEMDAVRAWEVDGAPVIHMVFGPDDSELITVDEATVRVWNPADRAKA